MTLPRRILVDDEQAQWYHIISRCVRRAWLCGDGFEHRKEMIRQRLELLSTVFCVEIAAYAIMDNHLHLVLRLDPHGADELSDREVARRWLQAFPKQWDWTDADAVPPVDEEAIAAATATPERIEQWRTRLANMGWCLKALKEPVARRCNKEDGCTGAFWEGRYQSVPLLDQAALVSCMAYVDLNPIRAAAAATPEQSDYTAIQDRISLRQLFEKQHGLRRQLRCRTPLVSALAETATTMTGPEDRLWLTPINACVTGDWGIRDNGLIPDDYFTLIDETGRIIKSGKRGAISSKLAPILNRLDIDVQQWIQTMRTPGQMMGAALGQAQARAAEAIRRGVNWVRNRCLLFADST